MILTTTVIPPVDPNDTEQTEQPPTPEPSLGLSVCLTGADGSVWDLINGPVTLLPGVAGLLPPNLAHRWATSPMLDAQIRTGYAVGVQRLLLPVLVGADSSLGWRDLDAALWRALSPDVPCQVTVTTPDARTRVMPAWFTGVGDTTELPEDPVAAMYATYRLEFDAEEPYWQGATTVQTLRPAIPITAYAPPGSAYVKALMPANSLASATLRNDGDVPAWPVYSITGSVSGFTVGVTGSSISYGSVVAGATVWIDTHPARQTVGFNRDENSETAWLGVTARDFAPVPPGAEVAFTVSLTSPGADAAVSVELTPRYRRPW